MLVERKIRLVGLDFFPKVIVQFVAFLTQVIEYFQIVVLGKVGEYGFGIPNGFVLNQFLCSGIRSGVGDVLKIH